MAQAKVEDLAVGELDPSGQQVRELYAKNVPLYGVYRTAKRVCVQFADDETLQQTQRKTLAQLGTLRSDINGLIDGWRTSNRHCAKARRRRFDRGSADALISAMSEDPAAALYQLTAVRNAILDERTAIGRFQYLGAAFAIVVATYVLLWLASFPAISPSVVTTTYTGDVLTAVAGGALGAFLSIAILLKGRTVLPDLQWVANVSDALLRMTVGIVAAAILLCLLHGGFGLTFGPLPHACTPDEAGCDPHQNWMQVFALGFVAGFFERLVPDLLDKAGSAIETPSAATPPPAAKTVVAAASPAPPGPDETGDCLCNQPLDPADATPDSALPPATGGVVGDGR